MKTAAKTSGTSSAAETASGGKTMPAVPVMQQKGKEKDEASGSKISVFNDGAIGKFSPPPANTVHTDNRQLSPFTTQKKAKGATPSQPAAGSLLQKKANNTGLPDNLKSGVEGMSGFSMDDVKVHYNSGKPAQLKAFAYAQGADIHIGPGQEKHLPHEAWHVVQQKQGRVKPTLQLKGVAVNDDAALEQEADVMGAKALSTRQPVNHAPLQTQSLSAGMPNQRKVIQLVASQIQLDDKGLVDSLIIQGRPPRLYGDTMGDHTTSFIIQIEGLNIALKGKTLEEAYTHLLSLHEHLTLLPGLKYLNKESNIGGAYDKEMKVLTNALVAAGKALKLNDQNQALQFLQTAISTYLHARELVPFSTINVSVESKGTAGKGRGESSSAAKLSAFEFNDVPISEKALVNATYKLFDDRSAGMASTQITLNKEKFWLMTGGAIDTTVDTGKLFDVIWQQHVDTVKKMYPKVFAKIDKYLEVTYFTGNLKLVKIKSIIGSIAIAKSILQRNLLAIERYNANRLDLNQSKKQATAKQFFSQIDEIKTIYNDVEALFAHMSEIQELNKDLNNEFAIEIIEIEEILNHQKEQAEIFLQNDSKANKPRIEKQLKNETSKFFAAIKANESETSPQKIISNNTKGKTALKNIRHLKIAQGINPYNKIQPSNVTPTVKLNEEIREQINSKAKQITKSTGGKQKTLNSAVNSMSIQITLNENGTIAAMHTAGRPPSPHKGTMGAHSTSWVVHLDRVRALIVNKTIQGAAQEIINFSISLVRKMKDATGAKGDNFNTVIKDAKKEIDFNKTQNSQNTNLSTLQRMINGALTYLNLIPGITRLKIDTGGKGEGSHRKVIKRFMDHGVGSRLALNNAITGLYDGGNSGLKDHYQYIQEAYGKLWTFLHNKEPENLGTAPPKNYPQTSNIDKGTISITTDLDEEQTRELDGKSNDGSWLTHVNNCLINAITDAAGIARATSEQIIRIRKRLGVPVGEMLYATKLNLDIILGELNLFARGAIVVYEGSIEIDESTNAGNNALYIYHDGINHFTPLYERPEVKAKTKSTTKRNLAVKGTPVKKAKQEQLEKEETKVVETPKRKRINSNSSTTKKQDGDTFARDKKKIKFDQEDTPHNAKDKQEEEEELVPGNSHIMQDEEEEEELVTINIMQDKDEDEELDL